MQRLGERPVARRFLTARRRRPDRQHRRGEIGVGVLPGDRCGTALGKASNAREERDLGLRRRVVDEVRAVGPDREFDALRRPETGAALLDVERAPSARFAIEDQIGAAQLGEHAIETALLREPLGLDGEHQRLRTERAHEGPRHLPESRLVHDLGGDRRVGIDDHERDAGRLAAQRLDQRLDALRAHQRGRAAVEFEQDQAFLAERRVELEAERVGLVHQRLGGLARDDLHDLATRERGVGELQRQHGAPAPAGSSDHERQAGRIPAQNVIDDAGARRPHLSPFPSRKSGWVPSTGIGWEAGILDAARRWSA